ncbi:MAG: hypothetical protein H5U20_04075 [Rhodobacteraceae bacterium]|nr:hypothetical protein [Paracoccaceae bacterium]
MSKTAILFDPASGAIQSVKRVTSARDPFVRLEQAGLGVWRGPIPDDWEDRVMVRDPDPEIGWRPVPRPEAELSAARLAAARADALARLPAVLDAVAEGITGPVAANIRASWPQKEAAALAVLAGGDPDPMLAAEVSARGLGETPEALAAKIAAKANAYRAAAAVLAGRDKAAQGSIAAATTPDEIAAALDAAGAPLTPGD